MAGDLVPAMLALARKQSPDIPVVCFDAVRLPFPDRVFDRVVCTFALHHIREQRRALGEAHRVLTPGGQLLVITWGNAGQDGCPAERAWDDLLLEMLGDITLPEPAPVWHEEINTPASFESMLTTLGFRCDAVTASTGAYDYTPETLAGVRLGFGVGRRRFLSLPPARQVRFEARARRLLATLPAADFACRPGIVTALAGKPLDGAAGRGVRFRPTPLNLRKDETMAECSGHSPGTFCWVDLATTDRAAARKFYGELFGWTFEENPAGPDMTYTMAKLGSQDVAGLADLQAEQLSQGVPPHWMSYVAVDDAAATAAKVKSLGGMVVMDAFDVMEHGRMAIFMDPDGALFSVWQPKSHKGAGRRDEPGTLCWNELGTRKTDINGAFYTNLFGWGTTPMTGSGDMPYTMFMKGETPVGGMYALTEAMKDVPPHWLPYFAVASVDDSFAKAGSLGAKPLMPGTDIPNMGRFAILHDPQGAVFAIFQGLNQ